MPGKTGLYSPMMRPLLSNACRYITQIRRQYKHINIHSELTPNYVVKNSLTLCFAFELEGVFFILVAYEDRLSSDVYRKMPKMTNGSVTEEHVQRRASYLPLTNKRQNEEVNAVTSTESLQLKVAYLTSL